MLTDAVPSRKCCPSSIGNPIHRAANANPNSPCENSQSVAPGIDAALGAVGEPGAAEPGYLHCGPNGAGHFVKMVHITASSTR